MKSTDIDLETERKPKVLIVDDNALQLKMAVDAIKDTYDVITAMSTKAAMGILKTTIPDLILIDVEMPESNGYDMMMKIKSSEALKDIPVIFLTSRAKAEDEIYGLSLGAADYIKKPYSAPLLLKRIELHLAFISQTNELHNSIRKTRDTVKQTEEMLINKHDELVNQNLRINLLLDSMDVAMWNTLVDSKDPVADSNTFWWSDEFRKMLGFSDESDFPNVLHSWSGRLHPDDKTRALEAFAAHINDYTGKTPYNIEYRLMLKDGSYRHFHAFGTTLRDVGGVPIEVVGALEDIHEKVQIQKMTERRTLMVDALNKALELFVSYSYESLDDVLTNGLRPIANAMGLDCISIYRYKDTDEGPRLGMTYQWERASGGSSPIDERVAILPDIQPIREFLVILMKGESIHSRVCDMTEEAAAFISEFGVKSIFISPVFAHGEFWGAVTLENHSSDEFFANGTIEAELLQTAARILAKTIIRAEAEQKAAEKNELNHILFNNAPVGLTVFDENFKYIDCNEAVLKIYGVTRQFYSGFFGSPSHSPEYQPDGSNSREKALEIIGRVMSGENMKIDWMYLTPEGGPLPVELTMTHMKQGDKYIVLGYIYDLRGIKDLEEKAEAVYYDALTEIHNRRYLDENLECIMKSLSRHNGILSLLMIDMDYFKLYNDTYGHVRGDNCLRIVAEAISKSITRIDDFAVRYGGEEFVVVLPNTDVNGALKIADKLLENVRKCNIPHKKSAAANHVTISIGVTTGNVAYTQSGEDYVKRADTALYRSKQKGRNMYTFVPLSDFTSQP